MSDCDDDGWPNMVCVETANVHELAITLRPGAAHAMATRYVVLEQPGPYEGHGRPEMSAWRLIPQSLQRVDQILAGPPPVSPISATPLRLLNESGTDRMSAPVDATTTAAWRTLTGLKAGLEPDLRGWFAADPARAERPSP